MRLPSKLDKTTLNEIARIDCNTIAITLSETPYHSATLTLSDPNADVSVGDWLRVYTPQHKSFVAVVKSDESDPITKIRTITADHVYRTLDERLIIGEMNPGGTNKDDPLPCTAAEAITAALTFQTIWILDSVTGYDNRIPYSFKTESIRSAIDSVLDTLEDYQIEFDTDRFPFRIKIAKRPSETLCEMRLTRNVSTMRVSIDKSEMWNRFYPIGNKDLYLDDFYVEDLESINTWGLVEHSETISQIDDKSTLRAYAEAMLTRYSKPLVTVTINGFDLADVTGEDFDRLKIGKMCRVPLPKYGVTYTQRITKLAWNDALKQPETVQVTLCNVRQNVKLLSDTIKKNASQSRHSARASSKNAKNAQKAIDSFVGSLDSAWTAIHQSTDQIVLAAQILSGQHTLTSSMVITGHSITSRVTDLVSKTESHDSLIEQLADSISLKADKVKIDAQIADINAAITNLGNVVNGGVIQASSITTNGLGINGNLYYHDDKVSPTQITSTANVAYSALGI